MLEISIHYVGKRIVLKLYYITIIINIIVQIITLNFEQSQFEPHQHQERTEQQPTETKVDVWSFSLHLLDH